MDRFVDLNSSGFDMEEFEDVKRCLETLLSVREGSQPLDREFGINFDEIVGYPAEVAKNMLSLEIIEKTERYEPRVQVESIEFDSASDGNLIPRVHFVKTQEG